MASFKVPIASESGPEASAPTHSDIEVREVKSDEDLLPAYYREGYSDFMKRAQARDPENRHRWCHISLKNQSLKKWKGWSPINDKAELLRLGLEDLINGRGRAQYMDVELWRMPMGVAKAIRKHQGERLARKSKAVRAALDAMADDTAGRTSGRVVPFLQTEGLTDLPDLRPNLDLSKETK